MKKLNVGTIKTKKYLQKCYFTWLTLTLKGQLSSCSSFTWLLQEAVSRINNRKSFSIIKRELSMILRQWHDDCEAYTAGYKNKRHGALLGDSWFFYFDIFLSTEYKQEQKRLFVKKMYFCFLFLVCRYKINNYKLIS